MIHPLADLSIGVLYLCALGAEASFKTLTLRQQI